MTNVRQCFNFVIKASRVCISYSLGLLNLLFPTASPRVVKNRDNDLWRQINKLNSYADVNYSLKYKDSQTKRTLWQFKYFLNRDAMRICTYILYDQLVADASDRVSKIPFRVPYIVLHYPSSSYFKGKKKFDHMKELTLLLDSMQNVHAPFFTCCIHAILPNSQMAKNLNSQHQGSRRQRFEWSKHRFILSEKFEEFMKENFKGYDYPNRLATQIYIYCIDDVVTTGASMQAVSDILQKKFNVEVSKFCICH